jgi:hypothetical protein
LSLSTPRSTLKLSWAVTARMPVALFAAIAAFCERVVARDDFGAEHDTEDAERDDADPHAALGFLSELLLRGTSS